MTLDERLPSGRGPDLCGRFGGRVIRGVNARAATPEWMKTRLERAGQRSLSALVDISNYVMLELGRPSHVFDLDKIQGDLSVRWAREGETLELLNGQTVTLDSKVGVVVAGDTVESLAGIMGGEATSVTLDTQNIYLEAAFWWPQSLAGRAPLQVQFGSQPSRRTRRGLRHDSRAHRIHHAPDRRHLRRPGRSAGRPDRQPAQARTRAHAPGALPSRAGRAVTQADVGRIFGSLGLEYTIEGDDFVVTPPSFRFDIEIEEDLIEEVARIYGFENIPTVPPMARAKMFSQPEVRRGNHALRRLAAAQDYQEVVNYSFVEADWERDYAGNTDPVRLVNPIASHLSVMRSSLIAGLVANIVHNANRKQTRVRLFELGRVFTRDAAAQDGPLAVAGVRQPLMLAGAAWGPAVEEQWGAPARRLLRREDGCRGVFGARGDRLRFEAAAHPALHPAAAPASRWTARSSAGSANCTRAGRSRPTWPMRRWCSNWTWPRCRKASCPRSASNRASPSWCATWPCGSTPRCRSSPCWTPSPRWPRPIPGWPCCAICACSTCGARSPRMACRGREKPCFPILATGH